MKKKTLFAVGAAVTGLIAVPTVITRIIFGLADKTSAKDGAYFKSALGNVYYTVKGEGSPVLLLHSVFPGSSNAEWQKNIDFLAQNYKVYAVDLPCYGLSDRQKTLYTAYNYALFVNEFIKKEIKEPTAVVCSGESSAFGALAERLMEGNITKIAFINPKNIADVEPPSNKDSYIAHIISMPVIGSCIFAYGVSRKVMENKFKRDLFFEYKSEYDDFLNLCYANAHRGGINSRAPFAAYVAKYFNIISRSIVEKIKIPVAVFWGDENGEYNSSMEILEGLRPDFRYYPIDKALSMPHYERAEKFNAYLKEFLDRI